MATIPPDELKARAALAARKIDYENQRAIAAAKAARREDQKNRELRYFESEKSYLRGIGENKARNRAATASIRTGTAALATETRQFTKYLWSGLSIIIIILLIAGTGTAAIMQIMGSLGWWIWPLAILIFMIMWRYKK